ncbi:MAG: glycoside hydrolase family 16 protein [Bacteroidota bacterium]
MKRINSVILLFFICSSANLFSQKPDPFRPDFSSPPEVPGMILVWNEEFNVDVKPHPSSWRYEIGYVRNQELQWYQPDNARITGGLLIIEGRKQRIKNPYYTAGSSDWRKSRQYTEFTSSSIQTRGLHEWKFGRFEIRARIDTAGGAWPAIWTLGLKGSWPSNGEIDIMEFYRIKGTPMILANFAWGTQKQNVAKWDDLKKQLSDFTLKDRDWVKKYHVWRLDWDSLSMRIYLDNQLINDVRLAETINPDGLNPFLQPHYLLLNLAIGANGGDPSKSKFPITFEVDWVRVYQKQ